MYVCDVVFCKIDHCIHIHWCIVMGLGHNDPWVESHMWPQQTWGQRSSRGQWPLVQVFGKRVSVSTYFDVFSNLIYYNECKRMWSRKQARHVVRELPCLTNRLNNTPRFWFYQTEMHIQWRESAILWKLQFKNEQWKKWHISLLQQVANPKEQWSQVCNFQKNMGSSKHMRLKGCFYNRNFMTNQKGKKLG